MACHLSKNVSTCAYANDLKSARAALSDIEAELSSLPSDVFSAKTIDRLDMDTICLAIDFSAGCQEFKDTFGIRYEPLSGQILQICNLIASKEKPVPKTVLTRRVARAQTNATSPAKSSKKEKKVYTPYALDSQPEQPASSLIGEYDEIMFPDYFGYDFFYYHESDLYQRHESYYDAEEATATLQHHEDEVARLIDAEVPRNDRELIDMAHTFVTVLKKFKDTFHSQYQPKNKKLVQICMAIVAKEHRTDTKSRHAEKKERRTFVPTNEPYARTRTLAIQQKRKLREDDQ